MATCFEVWRKKGERYREVIRMKFKDGTKLRVKCHKQYRGWRTVGATFTYDKYNYGFDEYGARTQCYLVLDLFFCSIQIGRI